MDLSRVVSDRSPDNVHMAPYSPITVARSDGVREYAAPYGQGTITNAPKDGTEDAQTTYRVLTPDHSKSLYWRQKLGQELAGNAQEGKNWILTEFPEGYVLYEHVSRVKGKADRTDNYLYGHPGGRTKKYRSPGEFATHIKWLANVTEHCVCKCCGPLTDSSTPSALERPGLNEEEEMVGTGNELGSVYSGEPKENTAQETGRAGSVQSNRFADTMSRPASNSIPPRVPSSPEQNFDSNPNINYIYRPGELVWYSKGSAWGLAVVSKRDVAAIPPNYLLQPLCHPLRHSTPIIKQQALIRPWFAWSVPSTTHVDIGNLTYDQVPWERVMRGDFGSGDPEVDGSILAAKAVDASYSLFDLLEMPTALQSEARYNGMFLGAEKIWVGEPVRLRVVGDDVVVMVVQQIIEKNPGTESFVILVGDIYKLGAIPSPYKDRKDWPTPNLPARMIADLRFRNDVADNANTGTWHEWILLEPMAKKLLNDIRGRWYEAKTLLPILRPNEFQEDQSRGFISDAGMWMNGRGDNGRIGPGQRTVSRLAALGRAVPPGLKISLGLNEPAVDIQSHEPLDFPIGHGTGGVGQDGSVNALLGRELNRFIDMQGANHQHFYGDNLL